MPNYVYIYVHEYFVGDFILLRVRAYLFTHRKMVYGAYMKGFIISGGACQWIVGFVEMILSSVCDSFFFFLPHSPVVFIAERISHFCLARNLIRPLGSTHNFTQSGWLILFIPNHLSGQHKLGKPSNTLFGWTTSFSADVLLSALQ